MDDRHRRSRHGVLPRHVSAVLVVLGILVLRGSPASAAESPGTQAEPKETLAGDLAPFVPPMLDRAAWKAKPPLPGMKEQVPVAIILHHTGVRQNPGVAFETKLRGLQSFSQKPGQVSPTRTKPAWPDLPYHYYVDHAGRIAEGREVRFAGDTNTGYNTTNYIQVVLEGEFDQETPGAAQIAALRKTLVWLMLAWNVPPEKISVHKDHAPTSCPGRNFLAMLPDVLESATAERAKAIAETCAGAPSSQFASTFCPAK